MSREGEEEKELNCPYCWQPITVTLDLSTEAQEFIEDCRVCCQPIQFQYKVEDEALVEFSFERAQ